MTKPATPPYLIVAITILFALTGNAVYFAYEHGKLEQQVLDNRQDINEIQRRMDEQVKRELQHPCHSKEAPE